MSRKEEGKLRFVVEFCRHGAREVIWDDLKTTDDKDWNHGEGELTNVGKRQQYILGRIVRRRYLENTTSPLFSEKYNEWEIIINSSPFNRTILSASAQLLGIFLPGTGPILSPEQEAKAVPPSPVHDLVQIQKDLRDAALPYLFQSFPVHSGLTNPDYMFNAHKHCKFIQAESNIVANDSNIQDIEDNNADLYKKLKEASKGTIEKWDLFKCYQLYDNLKADECEGLNPTYDLTPSDLVNLEQAALNSSYNVFMNNQTTQKLMVTYLFDYWGRILDSILKEDQTNKANDQKLKFALFSGHDINILPMLKLLEYDLKEMLPFASVFLIELYQQTDDPQGDIANYYVQLYLNNVQLELKKETKISLSKFKEFLTDSSLSLTDGSFEEWCNKEHPVPPNDGGHKNSGYTAWKIAAICLAVAFLLIITVTCFFVHKHRRQQIASRVPLQGTEETQYYANFDENGNETDPTL